DYLLPGHRQLPSPGPPAPGDGAETGQDGQQAGDVRYYADSGDGGHWAGQGAAALGLHGEVETDDFAQVLAGRDPRSGQRLISAQGSAGRRPRLGVGTETRGSHGEVLYDTRDAAAALGLPEAQVGHMIEIGTMLALARLFALPVRPQPEGSYLAALVDERGDRWVSEEELGRCEDALSAGGTATEIAKTGPPDELVPLAEAARLTGVTPQYLRRLAKRYETLGATIQRELAAGRPVRRAYVIAQRGTKGRWLVTRGELAAFVQRRRMPAVRVGFDLTLTTEKSLGILALLSDEPTRTAVLDAIRAGNDWAMGWLERNAAAARVSDKTVPVKGWTVASFQHLTSRALDPFPHWHNVVANTVEDHQGVRRALDGRGLYQHARAASALATAEMRHQLTRGHGARWRQAHHGGWEIAGIGDDLVREYSRRAGEIEDALRELEEIIGRGATASEIDRIKTTTRPDKTHVALDELLADWWRRAQALGFGPTELAGSLTGPVQAPEPDPEALYALLAAPDGICANLSIFDRADVLAAVVNQPLPAGDGSDPQPSLVPARRLEQLADGFLASRHVEKLSPGRYSTREMLAVQDRIVARYRHGRHRGAGRVDQATVDAALACQPIRLTGEQQQLVRSFAASGHRIQCAIGHAGAGKTTAMAAARAAWEAGGWRVLGAAVKGEAARGLGTVAGIPTETLAWYLAHDDPLGSPLDART
ncbi:MAG: MobF family relaxase, partial [Acidimicrobiales bacterium]